MDRAESKRAVACVIVMVLFFAVVRLVATRVFNPMPDLRIGDTVQIRGGPHGKMGGKVTKVDMIWETLTIKLSNGKTVTVPAREPIFLGRDRPAATDR